MMTKDQFQPNQAHLYEAISRFKKENVSKPQRPLIGISCIHGNGLCSIQETYIQAVLDAGGAPLLLPVLTDIQALSDLIDRIDGLLMTGGADINPLYFGEEPIPQLGAIDSRLDQFDLTLIRLAADRAIPIMGVCRGHQIVNVAFGGTLYQDIYAQRAETHIRHVQNQPREQASHTVKLTDSDSYLNALFGKAATLWVNSFHHQAIKTPGHDFRITALSPDGLIEGTQHANRPIFTIQWHPEALIAEPDMLKIYQLLIQHALEHKK